MSAPGPLDHLVARLDAAFGGPREKRGPEVLALLGSYTKSESDWRPLGLFSDEGYTRNLVVRRKSYELLILCWGDGQESPIHNHEGQDCWMAVLEGHVEEERFEAPGSGHVGPLESLGAQRFARGQVAFIRDELGLHLVRPALGPAVSMHLYAAPYDSCNVYCPETGRITRKSLRNHSFRGQLLQPDPAAGSR